MYRLNIHRALMALLLCTTMTYTNVYLANGRAVKSPQLQSVRRNTSNINQALNKLGHKDSGEAQVVYYRSTRQLNFKITDFNYQDNFKGQNLQKQLNLFTKISQSRILSLMFK